MSNVVAPPAQAKIEDDLSLRHFMRVMTPNERSTFWACAAGWALDGMDFMIFPLVIGTLIALWNVDQGLAGLSATATLLASAVGGWLAGYLSDRIGRVRALQFTILWFSVFSLVCAFAQDFTQLFIARTLLGFGFGGEWAAGAVLMGEAIRAQYRGRAVGCVQSGWAVGWGVAVLVQAILFSWLPAAEAWRYMFVFGALPALLVFFMRGRVPEPAISVETRRLQTAQQDRPSIWEIFAPNHLRTTVLASLMMTGAQGGYYAINVWLPRYLTSERGLSTVGSTGYLASLIIGSFLGFITAAWLSDARGRRFVFLTFSAGAILLIVAYTRVPFTGGWLWVLGFPLGFFATGIFSPCGPFLTEIFPTRLRGSGQGFCYNFGRGIGALFPAFVGYLSHTMPLGTAIAIFAAAAYGLLFGMSFLFPETRGKQLHVEP